jgi:pyruvate/2-oxoglutarate dehydrogenase complex dihydrolipoamide dehydrogenase (E3) component
MDYATHFKDVLGSSEFLSFKNTWTDICASSKSARKHARREGVLVVGAGVIGLTTALRLAIYGFKVHIIAEEFVPKDTMVRTLILFLDFDIKYHL